MALVIECLVAAENHVGESPVWDVASKALYWVDSTGRRVGKPSIWRYDPRRDAIDYWVVDKDIGALALREQGGAVLACADGFYTFDFSTGGVEQIVAVDTRGGRLRLNDGKCDRKGRFLVGGMDDLEELPACALYRLDPDFSLTTIAGGIICANGPCFSPDNKTFYLADTFAHEIWAFDYDLECGAVANRRVFADTRQDGGLADGSTVDAEGFLWNAQLVTGDLVRYAPDGSVERRIGMPVRNITSVMFGGADLDEIFVTSMARVTHTDKHSWFRKEMRPQFGAGALYRITGLGVKGLPEPRFAG